jgi:hypothetical protein
LCAALNFPYKYVKGKNVNPNPKEQRDPGEMKINVENVLNMCKEILYYK